MARPDDRRPEHRELERGFDELGAGVSPPSWGEVRDRLRARSFIKGRARPGGARRAGPSDPQDASVHDDRQGTMKEPSRRGPSRGASDRRPSRPRDDSDEGRRPAAPRTATAEELLDLADGLQDQARALMQQAKRLQRMAESLERAESARPARPPRTGGRPGGAERGGPRREGSRSEGGEGRPRKRTGEERPRREGGEKGGPRKRPGGAPEWAPKGGKKRRPT